jgi:small subunit ribosomal protein S17
MTTKTGTITSAGKMQDTVTVTVHMQVRHPLYKKSFRQSKKFLVDTKGVTDLGVGDEVIIVECRPLSKTKHFKIKEVLKRAARVSEMAEIADTKKAKEAAEKVSAPAQ